MPRSGPIALSHARPYPCTGSARNSPAVWLSPPIRTSAARSLATTFDADRQLLAAVTERVALETLAPQPGRTRNRWRHRALELARAGHLIVEWPSLAHAPVEPRGRERDNARGEAREREKHPEWYRFLDAAAPNHALKRLEAELYLDHFRPYLTRLGAHPRVLDLGGGTGRLALPLAEQGSRVTLADANAASLADAAAALAETECDLALGVGSAYDVGALDAASFDAALSIEVWCYLEEPRAAATELARVLRPGGFAFVSVEAWPGGLLAARGLDPAELTQALASRVLYRPDDLFVRYFEAHALVALLDEAGLETVALTSHHHVLEGPWSAALDPELTLVPANRPGLLALERALANDGSVGSLGRGWLAVACKR